ncbi:MULTISPECIES: FAD assembly factor SdhE [Paracoccus]|uniref:FAD assembly factor SdhE n=1 Tax=Paracoccus kondratievae TaxID=135740 RepID=A0AAD3P0V3_9RHOB|nr:MULTISPECIES: succinate dehydrogenase assembly factor 2 [Paracoccus]GLK64818.1 succinate dehydrogenase assembly factor 2 [Paracoccus kondratievae]SMG27230.1 antitoxin CptB [Paracoccus sp. J56]
MRSWRRGTKEMDLILGPFSDSELEGMNDPELDLYETLLDENDQDLYPWITARLSGRQAGPEALVPMLNRVARFAAERLVKK